jgi:hypothetical protein
MSVNETLRKRINSYEDACKEKGIEPLTIDAFAQLPENQRAAAFSRHKVETVIEVLKQGREFDWNDSDQPKYFPWFDLETYNDGRDNDGFVLHNVNNDYFDITAVGARLCSFSREDVQHVATIMLEDYKAFMR